MIPTRRLAALVACLALGATSSAHAGNQLLTFVGVVTAGADVDDLFGQAGADLTGAAIRADIVYATDISGTRTTLLGTDEVTGGISFSTDPVIVSATFTVDGSTFSFAPSYYGDVYTSDGGTAANPSFLSAYGYDELGNSFQTYILPYSGVAPTNLDAPFVATGAGDPGGATTQFSYLSDGTETVDFNPTSVRVSAAPEPAGWTLLLAGVGAAGLALRRRRAVVCSPAGELARRA